MLTARPGARCSSAARLRSCSCSTRAWGPGGSRGPCLSWRHWGPRAGRWRESKPPWRRTGATLIGACLALALALQLWSLHLLFRRVAFSAALNDAVMRRPESAVIAVGWFLPQELAHVFYNKQIFLAAD